MAGAGCPALRRRHARAAARRRNAPLETRLGHPIFDAVRPWLHLSGLEQLNAAAESTGLQTESGKPVRFVPPGEKDAYYEVRVFESGRVETRPDNRHDWFNALA